MRSLPPTATPVCLVIRWPHQAADGATATSLARRLADDHLPATWGVETVEQANAIDTAVQLFESALLLTDNLSAPLSDQIVDGIHRFEAAGRAIATICPSGEMPRGQFERQLSQQGVRGIVSASAARGSAAIRAIPFGLCQLTPIGTLPSQRRCFRRVGGVPQDFWAPASDPSIASIDLSKIGPASGSAWRELAKVIDLAATASDQGAIRLLTVADLVEEWARQTARPQRSILRAA